MESVISDLTSSLAGYAAAAATLVAAVVALRIGIKWAKGIASKAS
jgi:hypothetical protein